LKPSENAYALIRKMEGLVLHAYPDPATGGKPYTIGYGTTRHTDGSPVQLGETVTQEQAEQMMRHAADEMAAQITANVNQNQLDALTVFAYNCGIDALLKSTLYRKVLANPDDPTIENEFSRWVFAAGKIMPGLLARRREEYALYAAK